LTNTLLDKVSLIENRVRDIDQELLNVGSDYETAAELGKERSDLDPIVEKGGEYRHALESLQEARALSGDDDEEMAKLAQSEIPDLEDRIEQLERDLKSMLLPTDPRDKRNVIVEIRAGAGGDEAGIFAADLFRMYTRYAERQGWKTEILSSNDTGVGGIKEVSFQIKGRAW
jgi:peptide chain release factor 1